MSIQSVNPRTGELFGPVYASTSAVEVDQMIGSALESFKVWSKMAGTERARILTAVADALDANVAALADMAEAETGLGTVRLTGEVARTTFQIRTFAIALEKGEFISPQVDAAVDAPLPVGHPKFLRTLRGIGPVAVFGASNFPFAFSVLGGDTASALAAGCSVVIKAHHSHPQTSEMTFKIASKALTEAGAPIGLMGLGHGHEFGRSIVIDPRMRAGAFTGSRGGGRALFDLAQSREMPIPFYGELGSVNPVVVTESGLTDAAAFAGAYLDSLLLGNGQFCTNPSLLFAPANSLFLAEVQSQLVEREPLPFLSEVTKTLHDKNRKLLVENTGASTYKGKSPVETGFFSSPEVLVLSADDVSAKPRELDTECFGPTGVIITYSSVDQVVRILNELEGALAGSLFSAPTDPSVGLLLNALAAMSGRVAFNAWPTGVAVTSGQHHGGPYPAATSPLHTSVGIQAITRFLRPVTFQGVPDELYKSITLDNVKGK
jgi:NADP-dependent aldehyde dehydrogenase